MSKLIVPAPPLPISVPLLSITDAANQLGVSSKTVRRLIQNKAIAIHRIGRQIRISEADLAAYTQSRRES